MTGEPQTEHAGESHAGIPSFVHIKLRGEGGDAGCFHDAADCAPANASGACAQVGSAQTPKQYVRPGA